MKTKMIEIRDRGTTIAALAIRMVAGDEVERRFLKHEGYPDDGRGVVLMRLSDQRATSDPYGWDGSGRTMPVVHEFIIDNWDAIESGQVIDVQVLLGETSTPKTPEVGSCR